MNTKYELISAAKYFMKGNTADFRKIYDIALDDMFFQMQFVICDDNTISKHLEDFFVYLAKSFFMLESANDVAEWINENVTQKTGEWIRKNRTDMLYAEENGAYSVPVISDTYISGADIPDAEYMYALETAICELPEIHRNTAIAFYYDNLSMGKLADLLFMDEKLLKNRIVYIEKTLMGSMQRYCKEHGYQMKPVTAQRILMALSEMQKMYRYPHPDALYEIIASRITR